MGRYSKGANAERELIKQLWGAGFAIARVAGSGSTPLPAPDIVALNKQKKLAFECKAWKASYLNISISQMDELTEWCRRAGADFYIAWKLPRQGWLFLSKQMFNRRRKNYMVSKKAAMKKGLELSVILGSQSRLGLK